MSEPISPISKSIPIFTIGYGMRAIDQFIQLLKQYQITYLIDVRSKPYSKFNPEYSKGSLEGHIQQEGLKYVYMGDTLGGQPNDRSVYTQDEKVDYRLLRQKDYYQRGVLRLRTAWGQQLSIAIMCSEAKPENCHRSRLIAETLFAEGIDVMHIDENGELRSHKNLLLRLNGGQVSLFD